jgi:hypothetical protein
MVSRPPLELQSAVDWQAGEPLELMARWLEPARLSAAYPGVWLRDDVYALHGHYADRHTTVPMFERLGAGLMARIAGEPDGGPARAEDYEAVLAPMYAWVEGLAQSGNRQRAGGPSSHAWRALNGRGKQRRLRRLALRGAVPLAVGGLSRAGLGPLRPDLSSAELRRAGLRAVGEVVGRLAVPAGHVVFGHTHRAGPLPADDLAEWRSPGGARLHNTGCWVHEPHFLGSAPDTSPYRAGFAVAVEDTGAPALINLLDRPGPSRG